MTVHFGIYPIEGHCSYFEESKRRSIDLKTRPVNLNGIKKVALMFEEIKSEINGKLGYACICLDGNYGNYGNEIMKKFIECGLKSGFKNVEIINFKTAFYLNAMSQTNYKPLNGNETVYLNNDTFFELPEYSPICSTFTIDQNEIFSVTFDKLSFYNIPKVEAPFNIGKNAIGIDLGTSRCCVAVIRKNGITTVPLDNTGERLLPSYVSYDEENVKCGQIVVERLRNYSKSTIFDSKRIIGRIRKYV
uniref:Uncharacterized protein n=1 Tax=Panagrolaimus davidi TaxID=227884 RepID=A0A914PU84_9BILA